MPLYNGTQKIKISGVAKVYVGTQLVYQDAPVLTSITLSGQTTSLSRGAAFSFGGTVTAHYSNGATANVTSSTTFTGYNMAKAGTYTVTASYTENNITKTATYQLTVNKAWTAVWTGNKSKTVSSSGGSDVDIWTNNISGTATFRFTFTMSASGGASGSRTVYYNGSSTLTTTKPSSPKQMNITYGTNVNSIVGVRRDNNNPNSWAICSVSLRYWSSTHKFYLAGATGQYGTNGSATLTVTKIERYY